MKRLSQTLILVIVLGALTSTSIWAWQNPHARIERRRVVRQVRIHQEARIRHATTPWWRVGEHLAISLQANRARRLTNRSAAGAHARTVRRSVRFAPLLPVAPPRRRHHRPRRRRVSLRNYYRY